MQITTKFTNDKSSNFVASATDKHNW